MLYYRNKKQSQGFYIMNAAYVSLEEAKELSLKYVREAYLYFVNNIDKTPFANQRHCIKEMPLILWKKKGFKLAGTAYYYCNTIEMNINFLYSPDAMRFIKYTAIHELAHIINYWFGGRNHDKQWKYIAVFIGDDGKRCHDYKLPENENRKYTAYCACREWKLTKYRYDKCNKYRCRSCGQLLDKYPYQILSIHCHKQVV